MGNFFIWLFISLFGGYNGKIKSLLRREYRMSKHFILNSKFTWNNVGPEGGYFVNVAVDPQDSNMAILKGVMLWITRDGTTWQVLREEGLDSYVTFTGYHHLLIGVRDTLYRSSNDANTFVSVRTTGIIRAMSQRASDTVYLVQDSAYSPYLYKTTDGGINWLKIGPSPACSYITYAPSNSDILYAIIGTDSIYILRSLNGGITWDTVAPISDGLDVSDIEVNPENAGEVFVSCGFEGNSGLIYTPDSFHTVVNIPELLIPCDVEFLSSDTVLIASVIPTGIIRGIRGTTGWTFESVDTLTTCTDIECSGNVIYVSATTGALKSSDRGEHFTVNESGLHGTFTYSGKNLSQMTDETVYMPSIMGNALYITRNGGVSWEKVYIPDVAIIFDVEANPQNENLVYIACGAGAMDFSGNLLLFNILHSSDGGRTFVPKDTFIGNPDEYNWIETIHTFSDSPNVVIGMCVMYDNNEALNIVRSTDTGHTFPDTVGVFTGSHYEDFAGSNPVFIQSDNVIFASYDYGHSFSFLTFSGNFNEISSLAFCKKDSMLFYNSYEYSDTIYAFKITDSTLMRYPVPEVHFIYITENGGLYSIALDNNFVFYTGTCEMPFDSSEIVDFPVGAIRASSNEVLLFSYGRGVFRSTDAVAGLKNENYDIHKNVSFIVKSEVFEMPYEGYRGEAVLFSPSGRLMRKYSNVKEKIYLGELPEGVYFIKKADDIDIKPIKIIKVK